jgi:hypothetical protein
VKPCRDCKQEQALPGFARCAKHLELRREQKRRSKARYRAKHPPGKGSERKRLYDRFQENVERTEGCWLWRGKRTSKGYGVVKFRFRGENRQARAHRLSYLLYKGDLPPYVVGGPEVLHLCHNRACVNPEHLKLGSHKENMAATLGKRKKPRAHPTTHI